MRQLFALMIIVMAISCGDSGSEESMAKKDRLDLINELEQRAFKDADNFDTTTALSLVNNYAKFSDENPDDELTPYYLFKAGDMAMALHKPHRAIEYFDKVIDKYPDYEKVPYCMFLKGFVYEDQIRDLEKAKESYEAFIEKYPDHDMTEAARFSIKNLGKSPEDLIKEFEEKVNRKLEEENTSTQEES